MQRSRETEIKKKMEKKHAFKKKKLGILYNWGTKSSVSSGSCCVTIHFLTGMHIQVSRVVSMEMEYNYDDYPIIEFWNLNMWGK